MNVRAKMQVQSVLQTEYSEEVKFSAVYTGTPEDNTYASATPSAQMTMQINNKAVWGHFKPGKKYYLDFSEAAE